MTIQYYRKNVYGNELLYIANEDHKNVFRAITGMITIKNNVMGYFEKLGIQFEEVLPPKQ